MNDILARIDAALSEHRRARERAGLPGHHADPPVVMALHAARTVIAGYRHRGPITEDEARIADLAYWSHLDQTGGTRQDQHDAMGAAFRAVEAARKEQG